MVANPLFAAVGRPHPGVHFEAGRLDRLAFWFKNAVLKEDSGDAAGFEFGVFFLELLFGGLGGGAGPDPVFVGRHYGFRIAGNFSADHMAGGVESGAFLRFCFGLDGPTVFEKSTTLRWLCPAFRELAPIISLELS